MRTLLIQTIILKQFKAILILRTKFRWGERPFVEMVSKIHCWMLAIKRSCSNRHMSEFMQNVGEYVTIDLLTCDVEWVQWNWVHVVSAVCSTVDRPLRPVQIFGFDIFIFAAFISFKYEQTHNVYTNDVNQFVFRAFILCSWWWIFWSSPSSAVEQVNWMTWNITDSFFPKMFRRRHKHRN